MNIEAPETYIYENIGNRFEVHCSINRLEPRIGVRGTVQGETQLDWPNLQIADFEVIHAFMRILALIPDKVATAITINNEQLEQDSGAFLIQLVLNLITHYSAHSFQYRSPIIVNSLITIKAHLEILKDGLNSRDPVIIALSSSIIIDKIDCFYIACLLYIKFLYPELLKIHRAGPQPNVDIESEFIDVTPRFIDLTQEFYSAKTLKREFQELMDNNLPAIQNEA